MAVEGKNYQDVGKSLLARNRFFRYVPLHTILSLTTVSAVSDNSFFSTHTESISSFKASVIGGEGRETTASASNTVPAAKIEIGGDEANLAGFQGKDNSRKRP
ncbi:hypothetical protein Bca52824_038845 [Brassica carinata]|uniref:Uncharacterized protein n=1 Tax=Brassica carinata TaxID=52824 RepID=A0A8X7UXK8_BRACI|nr:hypothetical protein Bca52824_038845 [Brassica carinata]